MIAAETECIADACTQPGFARAMCRTHYARWRRNGDMNIVRPPGSPARPRPACSLPGCDRPAKARELCDLHYARWQRTGTPAERVKPAVLDRVMSGVLIVNGCWEWQRTIGANGYGQISIDNRHRYVHRVSYELHVGPIPVALQIDHLCRNRRCCNPAHLEPVTAAENVRRAREVVAG